MRIQELFLSLNHWRSGILLLVMTTSILVMTQAQTTYKLLEQDGQNARFAKMHIVTKGETLYGLSRKYSVSVKEIKSWNGLISDNIKIGQRIIIEAPGQEESSAENTSVPNEEFRGPDLAANSSDGFESHLSDLFRNPSVPENDGWVSEEPDETEWSPFGGGINNRGTDRGNEIARTTENNGTERTDNKLSGSDAPLLRTQQVYYQVKAGDDIYSIADKYKVRVDEIRSWNAIVEVVPGDVIIVSKRIINTSRGSSTPEPASSKVRGLLPRGSQPQSTQRGEEARPQTSNFRGSESPEISRNQGPVVLHSDRNYLGKWMETGNYVPYEGEKLSGTRFYALHKSLPVGSTFKVAIPQNNGYFEVKVVGRLTRDNQAVAALSYDCIRLMKGAQKESIATIYYD